MKKIMPVLLCFVLGNLLQAQDNAINRYFSEYLDDPTFEQLRVSEASFAQFETVETDDYEAQQAIEALTNLEGILVLMKEGTNAQQLYRHVSNTIENDGNYEELVSVEHKNDNVRILLREELSTIREFLLIVGSKQDFVLASLYGDIDLPKIMQLGKTLKGNSKDWFELVEDKNTKELVIKTDKLTQTPSLIISQDMAQFEDIQVFPNIISDKVNIQDKAAMDGAYKLEFLSLLGEPLQIREKVALPYTLELNDLPSGSYFIRLTNAAGVYKNFKIVKP